MIPNGKAVVYQSGLWHVWNLNDNTDLSMLTLVQKKQRDEQYVPGE